MNKLGSIPSKTISNQYQKQDPKQIKQENKKFKKDYDVSLSDKSKELKKELDEVVKVSKVTPKETMTTKGPGIYFVSGFDWFGAGSIKGNYDGIEDMSKAVDDAQKYSWDEQSKILEDIKKRDPKEPIVLVGHSFGGDSVVEVANELNSLEHGFREIDLLVTLDSVGFGNDIVPQNVKKNLNFLAQGPYDFLNDGPNIAKNHERTEVKNMLTEMVHSDLDDSKDIQSQILNAIKLIV